jgi:hypothetical protein
MEVFMRILVSVMTLALALAWSNVGEAQSEKSTVRGKATTQQKVQRPAKAVAKRTSPGTIARSRCAGYAWWGCVGWDPDPNVREMLARDVGDDD